MKGFALAVLCCAGMHVAIANDFPNHKVRIEGSGSRTVILEAGLGDTLDVWKDIQPRIADHCARTLAYTRAGYLGSDPAGDGPRDSATVVNELREELAKRNLAPPYVLVGHSLGGLYMQYFARNYPRDVVGLVLVDSTHWNQHMEIDTSANTAYLRGREVTLFMPWIMRREFKDSISAGEQVHESPPAQFVPTIVLSSTVGPKGETPTARALAARMQDEIAADFPGSQHIRVEGATHYIQRDRPEVVIDAVRRLAGCGHGEPPQAK
ncbi:MAG TPA: alpha/beta hydrolase [Steroidobacteraceae bacterium]|nr:alpha/beta hydrolase [Steroidobacteraceae bacterium]